MSSPQRILRDRGLRPRKALGQNFLVHADSARKIAAWAEVSAGERVLEIGPGLGALTEALLERGCRVLAVEKDRNLFDYLKERWPESSQLELHCADILEANLDLLFPMGERFSVVSNLPYSVSTPILEKLLSTRARIARMSLLLQLEVVERILAEPGSKNHGRLAIWIRTFCDVEKGPRVTPGSFYPVPDIDSALLRLTPLAAPRIPEAEVPAFQEMVALLFQHRRKTVRNALKDAKKAAWDVEASLTKTRIDSQRRPETLTIAELHDLARALNG